MGKLRLGPSDWPEVPEQQAETALQILSQTQFLLGAEPGGGPAQQRGLPRLPCRPGASTPPRLPGGASVARLLRVWWMLHTIGQSGHGTRGLTDRCLTCGLSGAGAGSMRRCSELRGGVKGVGGPRSSMTVSGEPSGSVPA